MSEGNLQRDAFFKLLDALSPSREEAGEAYEELRRRLIRFFGWEGCQRPEDYADEVLNRVAAKLQAGERIQNLMAYASGVSRLVLKEALRDQSREQSRVVLEFPAAGPADPPSPEETCFDRCLEELPVESRTLLLDYYQGDASGRIRNRKAMAGRLSISLNSLRNRALRLREKLEACVRDCISPRDVSPNSDTEGK